MRENPGMSQPARIEILLAESRRLRYEDPAEMVSVAELALEAAVRLDPQLHAPGIVADVRARAAAELGNAYRLAELFDAAEVTLKRALDWWRQGSEEAGLLAQIADYAASLLCHERRFPEALELLDAEYRFWKARGDHHSASRTLVMRGLYVGYAGEPRRAIGVLCQALETLDVRRDPALVLSAVHNLLWFLTEIGKYGLAARKLETMRVFYEEDGSRLNLLRLQWLEARIDAGEGRARQAERRFCEVRDGFAGANLAFPAGLVSLDLALLLLREERFPEIESLALELVGLFRKLNIPREAVMAVVLVAAASQGRPAQRLEVSIRDASRLLQLLDLGPKRKS